jgi:hypothetical protein
LILNNEILPNFIKRKHLRKGEKNKQGTCHVNISMKKIVDLLLKAPQNFYGIREKQTFFKFLFKELTVFMKELQKN